MTQRVLISSRSIQAVIDRFRPLFDEQKIEIVLPAVKERLSEEQLYELVGDVDGVICGDDYFTERVLRKAAPRLKVISKWGTGVDSINQTICQELGITVCNTPNAFTHPVADSTLAYLLVHARQINELDRQMRAGIWKKHPAVALRERVLGVIGVGRIGQAVVRRARAFGMAVLGHDPQLPPESFVRETGIRMVSKDELVRAADYISLHCDLNPTSHHLLGKRELALMKPSAYVINTARGPVIDESALLGALTEQRIAGAALDVFEDEPLPKTSGLRQFNTVLLAPHNSNASYEAHERVHRNTIEQALNILASHWQIVRV